MLQCQYHMMGFIRFENIFSFFSFFTKPYTPRNYPHGCIRPEPIYFRTPFDEMTDNDIHGTVRANVVCAASG
jgi:hypothetical protein